MFHNYTPCIGISISINLFSLHPSINRDHSLSDPLPPLRSKAMKTHSSISHSEINRKRDNSTDPVYMTLGSRSKASSNETADLHTIWISSIIFDLSTFHSSGDLEETTGDQTDRGVKMCGLLDATTNRGRLHMLSQSSW